MANKEHISILKLGAPVWNNWRQENDEIIPDFSGADLRYKPLYGTNLYEADLSNAVLTNVMLSNANLRYANLCGADLKEASLVGADLSMADLQQACLQGANLSKAVLYRTKLEGICLREANLKSADLKETKLRNADLAATDLSYANFYHTDLRYVNLSKANLTEAYLRDADLRHAELNSTVLQGTICWRTNFSNAKNLDSCVHWGPSIIDHWTILISGGLSTTFLRGCGLPDVLIEYLPSLLTEPLQFYSCFISYSNKDEEFARKLYEDLQNNGVRCWFAPEHLRIGDKIRLAIDESIRVYDKLLIVLSENSIYSKWVEHEVETALDKENERGKQVLFPIRLDNSIMEQKVDWGAKIRRERNIGDFTKWKDPEVYKKAFSRLLRDLKAERLEERL
jgi:uncharacterized protein YjbI with pentapeptide repeats